MANEFVMESGLYSLSLIGLHPFKKSILGYISAFVFSSTFLAMYFLNVAGVVMRYDGIQSLADSVDAIPAGQQVLVKIFSVIIVHRKFQSLFGNIERMWPNDMYGPDLESMINCKKEKFKKIFKIYRATIYVTGVAYVTKPLFVFSRSFATAWYIPCDYAQNSCYVPIVIGQSIYIALLAFAVVVFDWIFFAFLFQIHCELDKIKYGFRTLDIREDVDGDDPEVFRNFCNIVKHHNFLVKYTVELDNVYHLQILNHITTISATIVFGIFFMNMDGFPPSVDKLSRYIPYLISYHFQLYVYCMCGEEIGNQMQSVGDVLYQSRWYAKYQPKLAKGMLMVMGVSQLDNKLTIGGVWKLNLMTFMSVIKTSVSFHAFMQTIYKSN